MKHNDDDLDDMLEPFGVELYSDPAPYLLAVLKHLAKVLLPGVILVLVLQWVF